MCRNIKTLYNFDPPASEDEVRAAALQYVRKVSGFTKPSRANAEAFDRAVDAVAEISAQLLDELVTSAPTKDREVEAAKAVPGPNSASRRRLKISLVVCRLSVYMAAADTTTIRVPTQTRDRLRILAARRGESASDVVAKLVSAAM